MTNRPENQPVITSAKDSIANLQSFARDAMGTTFEIFIVGADGTRAAAAAAAAFSDIDRLEADLSRFIANSDIARLNLAAPNEPVHISIDTFAALKLSAETHKQTKGAFDITVGALYDCWLNADKTLRSPSAQQLNLARSRTGMNLLRLNEDYLTVQKLTAGVQIDLGGIGKGCALDKMAGTLCEWKIDTVLIHSGASTVLALSSPPGLKGWPITLSNPLNRSETLASIDLKNAALSGSGLTQGRHIIDPRPNVSRPVKGTIASWSYAPDAATADALSTAFMVMTPDEISEFCIRYPNILAMVVLEPDPDSAKNKILQFGPWPKSSIAKSI